MLLMITLSLSIKHWVLDIYTVPTASMQPTIMAGDWVLLNIWSPKVERNAVMAFRNPERPSEALIKRCVGMPLDSVLRESNGDYRLLRAGEGVAPALRWVIPKRGLKVWMNADNFLFYKPLVEQCEGGQLGWVANRLYINGQLTSAYTFQQDYYFFLGDNAEDSRDARQFGLVQEGAVFGKWVDLCCFKKVVQ